MLDQGCSRLKGAWKWQVTPFPFALLLAYQSFHQLLRLGELLQQAVHIFHTRATATRDTLAPTAINDRMVTALVRGHRTNNGLHLLQTAFIYRGQFSRFE